ncbi:hypothetical protein OZ410_10460 [Robiginitalea sp. M366]|uniref:hypothetical protein n=1 Tax=Robiginitalea aestuariiviva TaxID=3036903 RepID=UPI00240D867E|nr:hypothetical protein [Robiginitalea aestuariiviva]MDG1572738.1 hypothetical protein [Robiginitalea aestuariiviva]
MIVLTDIQMSNGNKKVTYEYQAAGQAQKLFTGKDQFFVEYPYDVSDVHKGILAIPFVSNFLPIAWFAGFDLRVEEVDAEFFEACKQLRTEFQRQFPEYNLSGNLLSENLSDTPKIKGNKTAMLFSGGVDAYATYIHLFAKKPALVTLHGADIALGDIQQWTDFTDFIEGENLLSENEKFYIRTNVRDFYTYQVELLLRDIGWWGKVQHGMSLIGALAPLTVKEGFSHIYIASSYTKEVDISWGSTPTADELIRWAGVQVHHDGYELRRQEKVDRIVAFAREQEQAFRLRVCYSELRSSFNCSNCEKCFRSILGIILNGEDPNKYGFEVTADIYNRIFNMVGKQGASKGVRYFWWELMEKAKLSRGIYVFDNETLEQKQVDRIRNGELDKMIEANMIRKKTDPIGRLRFIIRNKFPFLRKIYRTLRGRTS